ncbi:MFS general substrate transporter [Xylariaceae sp. FL0255]|nr:MFS general substrate transporter [Xylariaceae sp. FL0255]
MSDLKEAEIAAASEEPKLTVVSDTEGSQNGAATPEPAATSSPQFGGRQAWLQVAASFALYGNTLGLLNTFGVYQTYYENDLLRHMSPSDISWIGSIQAFFLMAVGVFIGPLYDAGYCRVLLIIGTLAVTLGYMFTSISTQYYQIFLAQGVLAGIGTSFLTIPSIALVPPYFHPSRRPWAMGTATLGSSLAGIIYPILFQTLQPRIGFPWAVRVQGFITLGLCTFAVLAARPRYKAKSATVKKPTLNELVTGAKLKDRYYIVYVIAVFFNNLGLFGPTFYILPYTMMYGGATSPVTPYLLSILNASSIFGRLAPSALSKKFGIPVAFLITVFLSSASVFYWTSATTLGGNIAFAILFGYFFGGTVAFSPVLLTSLTDDLSFLGTRLGVLNIVKGISSVAGAPISGAIIGSGTRRGYLGMQLFVAFSIFLSAFFSFVLTIMVHRKKKQNE